MAFWKKPIRLNLQTRITTLTVLGLMAVFVVMGFIGLRNQAASTEVVLQQRLAMAETIAIHVDQHIIEPLLRQLTLIAAQPGFDLADSNLDPEQKALDDLYRTGAFSQDVLLTDATGIVLAVAPESSRARLIGADFSSLPHFQRALATGQPQADIETTSAVDNKMLVSLIVPLTDANGNIVGAVEAGLDTSGESLSGFIAPFALGETGYVQVLDAEGLVIASTQAGKNGKPSEHHDLILSLLQRAVPTISPDSLVTELGEEFHEVIAFAPIARFGWGITVEQSRAEALAPITQARNQIMLTAMIALIIAIFFIWFTTRQVTQPVLVIAAAARRVAAGDLTTSITVAGHDEVAMLARDFEAMRLKLAAWGEELEMAVKQRTRELSILYTIDHAAAQLLKLEDVLEIALDKALEVLEIEAGGLLLLQPDGETLKLHTHRGLSDDFVRNVSSVKVGEGLAGRASAERKPVIINVAEYSYEILAPFIVKEGLQTLASVPLVSAGELVGALNLATRRPRAFPPEEKELLTAIGRQLGGAVANARLHTGVADALARELRLNEVAHTITASLNIDIILARVVRLASEMVNAEAGAIALVAADGETITYPYIHNLPEGLTLRSTPKGRGLAWQVVESGESVLSADYGAHPNALPHWVEAGVHSFLGVPLTVGAATIGALGLFGLQQGVHFSEHDLALASAVGRQAAAAVQNARLFTAVQEELAERRRAEAQLLRHLEQQQAIYHLTEAVGRAEALTEIYTEALNGLQRTLNPDRASILLFDADHVMRFKAWRGISQEYRTAVEGHSPCPQADTNPKPILISSVENEPTLEPQRAVILGEGIQALAFIPLLYQSRLLGKFMVYYNTPHQFNDEEIQMAETIAHNIAFAIERKRVESALRTSEQEYRTLVENATELIWTLDNEGRFTYINQQAEVISGHHTEDLLGRNFSPLIAPPEDLPRIQRIFIETLCGQAQSYEVAAYRKDGSVFHLSVNTTPLYQDGKVVGTINFGRDSTAEKEAQANLHQRMAELSVLFEVSSAMRGAKNVNEILPIVLEEMVKVVSAHSGAIFLVNEAGGGLIARTTYGRLRSLHELSLSISEGVCGYVAQTCAPYPFANLARDPHTGVRIQPLVAGVQGGVCVPLLTGKTLVGTLIIGSDIPRIFSDDEVRLLTAIADMAASAIHRAGLFEQLEHRVHELSTLFDVTKMVTATLRIEDVLEFVGGAATQAVHAEGCSLFLWDEGEQRLIMRAVVGAPPELIGQVKYRAGEGMVGWVFLEGLVANVADVSTDPRWKPEPMQETTLQNGQIRSVLIVPLRIGNKTLGALGVSNKIGAASFATSDELLLTTLAGQIAIAIENARLYEDVRSISISAIRSLAAAIDARDPYTHGHSEGVADLAVAVARELGWISADLEMLEFAALLHDVGKIAVPDAVLRKIEPLTPDEWNIIRLHPYHSAQIVRPIESLRRIVSWVYHHHERWDGMGYPDGLKGEAIPLAARTIAVVDAFNAMTTDRPYRKGRTVVEALAEIEHGAGRQFDPQVAQAFLQIIKRT